MTEGNRDVNERLPGYPGAGARRFSALLVALALAGAEAVPASAGEYTSSTETQTLTQPAAARGVKDYGPIIALAQKGDAMSQYMVGARSFLGQDVPKDYAEALKWWSLSAAQGNAYAESGLGALYLNGWGVAKDVGMGRQWLEKAAAQGEPNAIRNLKLVQRLEDIDRRLGPNAAQLKAAEAAYRSKDYAAAQGIWAPLADQGDAEAQYRLGYLAEFGLGGVKLDYQEAAKWYQKAGEQGNPPAQNALGGLYYYGRIGAIDYKAAFDWWRKAAEQGDSAAANNLGMIYAAGTGVPFQDYTEAANWYRKAADHGDLTGEYNLGELYKNGRGMPQDFAEADFYLTLALNQNVTGADLGWTDLNLANTRKMITAERALAEQQLKPDQLEAVRQRVAAWHPLQASGPVVGQTGGSAAGQTNGSAAGQTSSSAALESPLAASPPGSPQGAANLLGGTLPPPPVSHVLSVAQVQELASKNKALGKPQKMAAGFVQSLGLPGDGKPVEMQQIGISTSRLDSKGNKAFSFSFMQLAAGGAGYFFVAHTADDEDLVFYTGADLKVVSAVRASKDHRLTRLPADEAVKLFQVFQDYGAALLSGRYAPPTLPGKAPATSAAASGAATPLHAPGAAATSVAPQVPSPAPSADPCASYAGLAYYPVCQAHMSKTAR